MRVFIVCFFSSSSFFLKGNVYFTPYVWVFFGKVYVWFFKSYLLKNKI